MDYWFYVNFKETRAYQIWKAGLKFLVDNIDQKYMYKEMGEPMGFVGFLSPFYYLGPATYVDTGVNNYARFDQPPTENIT
jgi:hypothetical protein